MCCGAKEGGCGGDSVAKVEPSCFRLLLRLAEGEAGAGGAGLAKGGGDGAGPKQTAAAAAAKTSCTRREGHVRTLVKE